MPKPEPIFKDDNEKREFLNSYRDVYVALGYTDEQIGNIIDEKVNDNGIEQRFKDAKRINDQVDSSFVGLYTKKYTGFSDQEGVGGYISRVLRAMYKPENTLENIQYNELLSRKLQSKAGLIEVLQEAVTILATTDPHIYSEVVNNTDLFIEHYNEAMLGFAAKSLYNAIVSYKATGYLTDEDIPREVMDNLEANAAFYETASAAKSDAQKTASIYDFIIPQNVTAEQIAKLSTELLSAPEEERRSIEEINAIGTLASLRESARFEQDREYVDQDQASLDFYNRIKNRMDAESENYALVARNFRKNATEFTSLLKTNAIGYSILKPDNQDDPVKVENNRRLLENEDAVKEKAYANYKLSFKDATKKMLENLNSHSIMGHHNTNYEKMIEVMDKLKTITNKEEISLEDIQSIKTNLKELDKAAEGYIKKKYDEDTEVFSNRALKRIEAAKLVSAYARGRLADMILVENKAFKAQITKLNENDADKDFIVPSKEYTKGEVVTMFNKAMNAYQRNRTPESFAVAISFENVWSRDDNVVIKGSDLKYIVENNKELFKELAAKNPDFAKSIEDDGYRTAKNSIENAVRTVEFNQKHEQNAQAEAQAEVRPGNI